VSFLEAVSELNKMVWVAPTEDTIDISLITMWHRLIVLSTS
jgi:hypothetical protein